MYVIFLIFLFGFPHQFYTNIYTYTVPCCCLHWSCVNVMLGLQPSGQWPHNTPVSSSSPASVLHQPLVRVEGAQEM